ncbi:MAG: hypothetical protein IKZ95_01235 [Lachnospiraceae bacterium]|nr:hypothetical protein [Lachnospiraceae bacterium]
MGIEARLKELLKEIDEEIDVEAITGESRLVEDIGMSSVALLYMAVALEEEFGIDFTTVEIKEGMTVDDIVALIPDHDGACE